MLLVRKPRHIKEFKQKIIVDSIIAEVDVLMIKLLKQYGYGNILLFDKLPHLAILYLSVSEAEKSYKYPDSFGVSVSSLLENIKTNLFRKVCYGN